MSKHPEVCKGCVHWRPLSESSGAGLYACHCLLDTGKRSGTNEDRTACTTYDPGHKKSRRKPLGVSPRRKK